MRQVATGRGVASLRGSAAKRIVLVAPDPGTQSSVQMGLGAHGFLVAAASSTVDARRMVELESPAALVVDARGDKERAFAVEEAQRATPPLFALIDPEDGEAARELLGGGADIVPIGLVDSLLVHRLRAAVGTSKEPDEPAPKWGRRKSDMLVGRSREILLLKERIDMIAKSDMGVAVYGETGTGKELAARTIHARSRRADKPFVVANCTALPEALFENELFGHERGAFTGADTRNEGLLSEAEGGTLLLDEIGDITGPVQAKLLRLLQSREYKMIGGTKTLKADVRILTTTHRDLGALVSEGSFREDLFYRMSTLQIVLPPLRDRLEDVPLLVDHFVSVFNEREARQCEGFTPAAIRLLQEHDWPGNVRELEGVVYRSLVMAGSNRRLDAGDVDLHPTQATRKAPRLELTRPFAELRAEVIEEFERSYLDAVLKRTRGNLSQAAREAAHERKSLWRLLNKYGIDPRSYKSSGGRSGSP